MLCPSTRGTDCGARGLGIEVGSGDLPCSHGSEYSGPVRVSVAAEHALHQAAQAGVVEATLPRASRQSVLATVERRLARKSIYPRQVKLTLLENDIPYRLGAIRPVGDDDFGRFIRER